MIESLLRERRENERELRKLQEQIDLLRSEREKKETAADPDTGDGSADELDRQIEELTEQKRNRGKKLKDLCRIAQTISAGD